MTIYYCFIDFYKYVLNELFLLYIFVKVARTIDVLIKI